MPGQRSTIATLSSPANVPRMARPSSDVAPVGSPSTPLDDAGAPPRCGAAGAGRPASRCNQAGPARFGPPTGRWRAAARSGAPSMGITPPWCHAPAPARRRPRPLPAAGLDECVLVPAVGADQDDTGTPGASRAHQLDEYVRRDRVSEEQYTRECGMFTTGPVGQRWRRRRLAPRRGRHGDRLGDTSVRVERQVRTVLLERTEGHQQDHLAPGALHVGPGGAAQLHPVRYAPACATARGSARERASRPT